jgi:DNA-binding beta-propeller fold protein YncE
MPKPPYVPTAWQFIGLCLLLCALSSGTFAADPVDWRYDRMWPELEQPWYFNQHRAVAVAVDGDIYVADTGNHRIQRFSATGTFLGVWGSEGSGEGQFNKPVGIAVATDGTVTVADSFNARMQQFN